LLSPWGRLSSLPLPISMPCTSKKPNGCTTCGAVTLSGQIGDDAKPYQEKQVRRAIEEVQE